MVTWTNDSDWGLGLTRRTDRHVQVVDFVQAEFDARLLGANRSRTDSDK